MSVTTASELLRATRHRPWPPPARPWAMVQSWHELLFAHWPVDPRALRALVPSELELDLFDGRAWFAIAPFRMSNVRVRGLPPLPSASAFPELNLRTYVRCDGASGVWFFSLDARSALAVNVARRWFRLPYYLAQMRCEARGEWIEYSSVRTHRGAPPAELRARYRPIGPIERAPAGSLEHWLTERYCLFARTPRGALLRGDIHHEPWPLQPAQWELESESLAASSGIERPPCAPLLHYAHRLDVLIWTPRRVAASG